MKKKNKKAENLLKAFQDLNDLEQKEEATLAEFNIKDVEVFDSIDETEEDIEAEEIIFDDVIIEDSEEKFDNVDESEAEINVIDETEEDIEAEEIIFDDVIIEDNEEEYDVEPIGTYKDIFSGRDDIEFDKTKIKNKNLKKLALIACGIVLVGGIVFCTSKNKKNTKASVPLKNKTSNSQLAPNVEPMLNSNATNAGESNSEDLGVEVKVNLKQNSLSDNDKNYIDNKNVVLSNDGDYYENKNDLSKKPGVIIGNGYIGTDGNIYKDKAELEKQQNVGKVEKEKNGTTSYVEPEKQTEPTTIKYYIASDGTKFTNEEDMKNYEKSLKDGFYHAPNGKVYASEQDYLNDICYISPDGEIYESKDAYSSPKNQRETQIAILKEYKQSLESTTVNENATQKVLVK